MEIDFSKTVYTQMFVIVTLARKDRLRMLLGDRPARTSNHAALAASSPARSATNPFRTTRARTRFEYRACDAFVVLFVMRVYSDIVVRGAGPRKCDSRVTRASEYY